MPRISTVLMFIILAFTSPHYLLAEETPLYRLAKQYEAEVKAFERSVLAVRGVFRVDGQLVDRFALESGRLALAAKNPRHFDRTFHQWRKVQDLSRQTESTFFGKYTPTHDWLGNWDRVLYAEALFAEEFALQVENPSHETSVRRLDVPSTRRDHYLAPPTIAPEPASVQP